jgi:hypothetical protein
MGHRASQRGVGPLTTSPVLWQLEAKCIATQPNAVHMLWGREVV